MRNMRIVYCSQVEEQVTSKPLRVLSKRRLKPLKGEADGLPAEACGGSCRVRKRSTSVCAVERRRLARKSSSRSSSGSGPGPKPGSGAAVLAFTCCWCAYGEANTLVVCALASTKRPIAS